ncbi:XRE family transcriptional regulator [Marinobacterium lutimaris]|nr:S24 family peptidase [Marinobacterium lutimaris]
MDNVSRNVAALMTALQISQRELARRAGVSQPTIHKIVKGGGRGGTDRSKYIDKVAEALGVKVEDLYKETTPISSFTGETPRQAKDTTPLYRGITEERYAQIPVRSGASLSAGSGFFVDDEQATETVPVSLERLRSLGVSPSSAEIVNVSGESMFPTLWDGDQVLVDTAKNRPQNDKVFAFLFDGETRVKRFSRKLDGSWRIISDNEDKNQYPDEVLANHNMDMISIIGEVMILTYRRI